MHNTTTVKEETKFHPPSNSSLGLKTCQLLLVNYNNIYNAISKPGADKTRFASLIKELEADILLLESFPNSTADIHDYVNLGLKP